MNKRWELTVEDEGKPQSLWRRRCTTADNAKTWARAWSRGSAELWNDPRFVIYDPHGRKYAIGQIVGARLRWTWVLGKETA